MLDIHAEHGTKRTRPYRHAPPGEQRLAVAISWDVDCRIRRTKAWGRGC
jgi:hypothetical protein